MPAGDHIDYHLFHNIQTFSYNGLDGTSSARTGTCESPSHSEARTTFYAHYRNVDDVLLEVEDGLLAGLADVTERVSGGDLPSMDFVAFLDETFGFIRGRWRDFRALLVDQPDARFVARWKEAVMANFARRHPQARLRQNWDLVAEMAASAVIGAYTWWMEHPDATGVEEAKRQVVRVTAAIVSSL